VTETTALALWQQPGALARIAPPVEGEKPLSYVARLMDMLPPPSEDAAQMFAAEILNAGGPADENAFWDAETLSSKNAEGRSFIFRSCFIHESDHPEGVFPYYLAVQVTDLETGEDTVLTTGSANIVTALVKAQLLGALPWEGKIVGPRRQPKSGHRPLHILWGSRIVEQPEDGAEDGR
jgi:hypothetical protein